MSARSCGCSGHAKYQMQIASGHAGSPPMYTAAIVACSGELFRDSLGTFTGTPMTTVHTFVSGIYARTIAIVALCVLSHCACAQPWQPMRPVALVVGATPGGSLDLTARLLQRIFDQQKLVPTPVIVLNK